MRKEFVANVSHELKTPITSIKGFVETLKMTDNLDDDTKNRFLTIIENEATRLTRLIDDILLLSTIENKTKKKVEKVDLFEVFEEVHEVVNYIAKKKNAKVKYIERHYGEGDGNGENVMNPQTIVYLGENSTMQMDTVQIRGIDSTLRDTRFYCEAGSEVVVTERLLTHGDQTAESDMTIELNGQDARGRVISRSVAQDGSRQVFRPVMVGNSQCFGHVQCDSIIMGAAHIQSVPAITANCPDAQLIHEAAIGKIAGDQLLKLETLGLTPEEAEETILKGFLA